MIFDLYLNNIVETEKLYDLCHLWTVFFVNRNINSIVITIKNYKVYCIF